MGHADLDTHLIDGLGPNARVQSHADVIRLVGLDERREALVVAGLIRVGGHLEKCGASSREELRFSHVVPPPFSRQV